MPLVKASRFLDVLPTTLLLVSVEVALQIFKYQEIANISPLAMIFLRDNILLERDLSFDDIKPRLLGVCRPGYLPCAHWLIAITRSLGNMPRLDIGLLASQPTGHQTQAGYYICCWSGSWCTSNPCMSVA